MTTPPTLALPSVRNDVAPARHDARAASPIRFQLLHCQIEIDTDSPAVRSALAYLTVDAQQDVTPHAHALYRVAERAGVFDVFENGIPCGSGLDPQGVLHTLYTLVHEQAYRAHPPHLRIHAGLAAIAGQRIMIVGPKRAGKTSLTLRLAQDGVDVQGDELVVIDATGCARAFPRRFHVRSGTFRIIPELEGYRGRCPSALTPLGNRVHALAPTDLGRCWHITGGPVDAIIHLERQEGHSSRLHRLEPEESLARLQCQTTLPERSVFWVSTLIALVDGARNYLLHNGDLTTAAAMIKDLSTWETGGA